MAGKSRRSSSPAVRASFMRPFYGAPNPSSNPMYWRGFVWAYDVLGTILATREAVKHFGPAGGSVINVGSLVSELALPASVVYTATKHAVNGVTEVLAAELAPRKIRVNAINPGVVATEGTRSNGMTES